MKLGHWRMVVNRAYYTVFHVASAALLWLDVERSRHAGVQSAFGEYLVKPGRIPAEYSKIFARARKFREEQEYDLDAVPLTAKDVEEALADAERFVVRLERFLREEEAIE